MFKLRSDNLLINETDDDDDDKLSIVHLLLSVITLNQYKIGWWPQFKCTIRNNQQSDHVCYETDREARVRLVCLTN